MRYEEFQAVFEQIDINVVPLQQKDSFAQARSNLKYIEAGAWGIPTIASPASAYREAIVVV